MDGLPHSAILRPGHGRHTNIFLPLSRNSHFNLIQDVSWRSGTRFVGTIILWKLLHVFRRRTLYLAGLSGLTAILWIVGFISTGAGKSTGGYYAQASLMFVWLLVYYMTIGPICYAIIGEMSSTRLRNKSMSLSRSSYYIWQIICNVINPYMLNPSEGDWKGKTGFFWGGCAFVFLVWTWFRLPESKDSTFEELDLLFAQKVGARDFSKTVVGPYAVDVHATVNTTKE